MRKFFGLFVVLFVIFSLVSSVFAVSKDIYLEIGNPIVKADNQELQIEAAPYIKNNRTMVPIRVILQEIGDSVDFNPTNKEVKIKSADKTVSLINGIPIATITNLKNQEKINIGLDVAPEIVNDRMFVPLRFIAESFHFFVMWNAKKKAVLLNTTLGSTKNPDWSSSKPKIELQIDSQIAKVNDNRFFIYHPPYIKNSRTMIPLGSVFMMIGERVASQEKSISVQKDGITYVFYKDLSFVRLFKDGELIKQESLDASPEIQNDCFFIPIRCLAELFNFSVEWRPREKLVLIS